MPATHLLTPHLIPCIVYRYRDSCLYILIHHGTKETQESSWYALLASSHVDARFADIKLCENVESINSRLALVMKSGVYTLGYKSTLKSLRQGKCVWLDNLLQRWLGMQTITNRQPNVIAKLIIISGNCPTLRKSELEYYAMLSRTAVHHYVGSTSSSIWLSMHRRLRECNAMFGRWERRMGSISWTHHHDTMVW